MNGELYNSGLLDKVMREGGDRLPPLPRQWGILFRWRSAWVGLHYSVACKRFCLNILPCVTVWWTQRGGEPPDPRKM